MSRFRITEGWIAMGLALLATSTALAQTAVPPSPLPPVPPGTPGFVVRPIGVQPAVRPKPVVVRPVPPSGRPVGLPPPISLQQRRTMPQRIAPGPMTPPDALAFDALTKEYSARTEETSAHFTFNVTNTSAVEVAVNNVHTSCGCTVAKLPAQPWKIAPGGSGPIGVTVDLRGKRGLLTKSVTIQSTSGVKSLFVKITIPDPRGPLNMAQASSMLDPDRVKNIQLSLANRQTVFKNKDCAVCHADKAHGKLGQELYDVICAICHDTPHRATMVPDLHVKHPASAEEWKQWISFGKTNYTAPNTLMPAFAKTEGGPLTYEQISSLVDYLTTSFPHVPGAVVPVALPTRPGPIIIQQPFLPVAQTPTRPEVRPKVTPLPDRPPAVIVPTAKVEPPAKNIPAYPFPKEP